MTKRSKTVTAYVIAFALIALAAVTFRTLALFLDFEENGIHFGSKAMINTAGTIAALGSVLLFTYAFTPAKDTRLRASFASPATYVPTLIITVALLYYAAVICHALISSGFSFAEAVKLRNYVQLIKLAQCMLSALSVFYFILNATVEKRASVARGGFGIVAVIFFALHSASLYFDKSLPINAPNKVTDQMAYLFFALFFLYEIRISLGRECWGLYTAFGFIAATLGAYSSLPTVIYYFAGNEIISASVAECALTLTVTFFIVSRVILATTLREDKASESVALLKEYYAQRDAYVSEKEEIEKLAYIELYNRMSENGEIESEPNESDMFPEIEYSDGDETEPEASESDALYDDTVQAGADNIAEAADASAEEEYAAETVTDMTDAGGTAAENSEQLTANSKETTVTTSEPIAEDPADSNEGELKHESNGNSSADKNPEEV